MTPLVTSNPNVPGSAWLMGQWWTKGGTTLSQSTMNQVINPVFQRLMPAVPGNDGEFYKRPTYLHVLQYVAQRGYTQWTSYQPVGRFWPFQWIEGGWLLALSVALIAATVWLVRRRAA